MNLFTVITLYILGFCLALLFFVGHGYALIWLVNYLFGTGIIFGIKTWLATEALFLMLFGCQNFSLSRIRKQLGK